MLHIFVKRGKDKKKEFFSGILLPNSRILLPADAGAFSADSVIFTIPESFRCSVPSFPVRLRADGGAAWDENGFLLFLLHMGGKNLSMKGGPFPDGRPNLERNLSLKKRSFRFIPHPPIDFFRKMLYNKFNVKAYVKSMGGGKEVFSWREGGRGGERLVCVAGDGRERKSGTGYGAIRG